MTSPAKIAANRRNARRSTGPRSAAGKARARRNAFRHGLTTPASLDHVAMDRIDNLVDALTIDVHGQLQFQLATVAAEAQAEIERVRQTKVNLVNRASAQLREEGARLLSAGERAALAFAGKTEILMACERYERRAISRRNRALRALAKLQRELRREEAIELSDLLVRSRRVPGTFHSVRGRTAAGSRESMGSFAPGAREFFMRL